MATAVRGQGATLRLRALGRVPPSLCGQGVALVLPNLAAGIERREAVREGAFGSWNCSRQWTVAAADGTSHQRLRAPGPRGDVALPHARRWGP
jgi:hypothetical protein